MSPELLRVEEVGFQIRKSVILQSVSFKLAPGRTVAVVGHNGAGKTTLFHLILGLKLRTSGKLELLGLDVERPEARRHLGFVPERPYFNLELTFRKTLRYLGALSGMKRQELDARIARLAEELQLARVMDQPLKTYSKGMLQKTLLAQALLHDPSLLILDEPMSGLDPEARDFLRQQMKTWKASAKSILFSSHAMEDVRELADDVVGLEGGRLTYFGPLQEWRGA